MNVNTLPQGCFSIQPLHLAFTVSSLRVRLHADCMQRYAMQNRVVTCEPDSYSHKTVLVSHFSPLPAVSDAVKGELSHVYSHSNDIWCKLLW